MEKTEFCGFVYMPGDSVLIGLFVKLGISTYPNIHKEVCY